MGVHLGFLVFYDILKNLFKAHFLVFFLPILAFLISFNLNVQTFDPQFLVTFSFTVFVKVFFNNTLKCLHYLCVVIKKNFRKCMLKHKIDNTG